MLDEIKQVQETATLIYSEQQVETALDEMAQQISLTLLHSNPVVLCVLNGGIVTLGKLLTRLDFPLTVDSLLASRYRNQTRGGEINWQLKPATDLQDRTVLIVDDILDEGHTLKAIIDFCRQQGAREVYSAVLVEKKLSAQKPVEADFVGLMTENYYLFGYGMDYKGYLRNAAGIYACKELQ